MLSTRQPEGLDSCVIPAPAESATGLAEERRASGRIRAKLSAKLVGCGPTEVFSCTALDIGAGGLYLHALPETEVAVGQRYEIALLDSDSESSELAKYLGNGCYATVVRTERIHGDDKPMIGAGLRFDQPLVFWEPAEHGHT